MESPSSSLADLTAMLGGSSSVSPDGIDMRLLWMSAVALLNSGASLQVGMNRARTSLVVSLYDGDFPHKEYCDTLDRFHFVLASVVQAYMKRKMPEDWVEVVRQYLT